MMKKTKLLAVACFSVILIMLFNGCAKTDKTKETARTHESDNTQETIDRSKVSDEESDKIVIVSGELKAAPNYEYQLYLSDDFVLGEIIEEVGSKYSDPDGSKGLLNAWETKYILRVEKSFKGYFKEGDEVTVKTWNRIGIYPEEEEQYKISIEGGEFVLQEGQRGLFMLDYFEAASYDEEAYNVVYSDEGVFEPKETGTASMNEDHKQVYASPSFEITLDQIPADIQRSDEMYKGVNKDGNGDEI